MTQTTISSKNQITLPKSLLLELGLGAGSKLFVKPVKGEIILEPQTKSLTKYYLGSGKMVWSKIGGGINLLKRNARHGNR